MHKSRGNIIYHNSYQGNSAKINAKLVAKVRPHIFVFAPIVRKDKNRDFNLEGFPAGDLIPFA